MFNPLSANPTKWSNTLKQFVGNLRSFILWNWCWRGLENKKQRVKSDMSWCNLLRKAGSYLCATDNFSYTLVDFHFKIFTQERISSVKSSVATFCSNSVADLPFGCWKRTLKIAVIKYFWKRTFKKITIAVTKVIFMELFFCKYFVRTFPVSH